MTKEELAKAYANEFNKEYQQIAYDAFLCGYGAKCDTIAPNGLKKAAEEWCKKNHKGIALSYDGSHYLAEGIDAFIAGAEWQKDKMLIRSSKKEVDEFMSRCDRDVLDELDRWRFTTACQEFIEQGIFDYGCAKHFAEWMKAKMMEKSYLTTISANNTIPVLPMKDVSDIGLDYGDKVRVIVIKED